MISVIIITKNEAVRLSDCLSSVHFADEIIVLDSGSTDDTLAIAQKFTPHVYVNTDWQGYGIQKQRALNHATGDWVLHIDADERVSKQLETVLLEIVKKNKADACKVPIQFCFNQKPLRFSSSPTRHARFFKRRGAHFSEDVVHEKIVLDQHPRIIQLKAPILHHSYHDLSHAIHKMNQYSSYSASARSKGKPVRTSLTMSFLRAFWMFIRCYILQGGFLDGKTGLVLAVLNAEGSWYRGLKLIYPDVHDQVTTQVIERVE